MKFKFPWLVQLLYNPVDALDLRDKRDVVDHGKVMGFFIFLCLMALIFAGKLPSLGHTLIIVAAAYGFNMFREFLKTKSVSYQQTVNESIMHTIAEKRDTSTGAQPTP